MWPNPQILANLVTFTVEIFNWKTSFFVQWWTLSYFTRALKLYFSPEFLLNFMSTCVTHYGWAAFLNLWGSDYCIFQVKKTESKHFYPCLPRFLSSEIKFSSKFLSPAPSRREITHFPSLCSAFFENLFPL